MHIPPLTRIENILCACLKGNNRAINGNEMRKRNGIKWIKYFLLNEKLLDNIERI
jgi:hypothetical protein